MEKRRSWKKAVVIGIALAMGVMPQAFAGSSVTIDADGVPTEQQEDWLHNDDSDVYYGNGSYADTDTGYEDEDSTYANGNTINVTGNESGYNILGGVFDDTHTTVGETDTGIVTASGNTVEISSSTVGDVYGAYGRVDDEAITLSSTADNIDFHVIANSNTVTIGDENEGSTINGDVYGSHAQVSVEEMNITFAAGDDASADDTMEFAAIAGGASGLTVERDDSTESGITVTMTGESEDLGNKVNITNSTVNGSVFGGSAYIYGGAIGITNNSTDADVNEKAALVAYANYNIVTLTDTSVGGDVVGGYAVSSVASLTNNVPGGTVNDRDRDNLVANASNNRVNITGGSVTGDIYGGSAADIVESIGSSEEYFLGSELYAYGNSISLDGVTLSNNNVYASYADFYLSESGSTESGQIKVPAKVGGNSIAISGAADVSGANLYGTNIYMSYTQDADVEYPYIVTDGSGNTLTLDGTWVDSGAATIGSIHNFDTISLENLNYTFTNTNAEETTDSTTGRVTAVTVNKDITITTADGMGSVSVTEYEFTPIIPGFNDHDYPFSFISASYTPLTISAAAAAVTGFTLDEGTDYTVKTNFNSTTNLNFSEFTIADYVITYAYDEDGEIDYSSLSIVGPGYEAGATDVNSFSIDDAIMYNNFDTSAIATTATYENIDTSNADGVRVHILGNIQAADVTVSTDGYTAGDSRTYSYTLTGDITDSILTGSYTNAAGTTTATSNNTLILGSSITSSNAEIIAGAYNASGDATGGTVNINGTFTPTGITYNTETAVDSIYAGYSNGGSVTGNTVNLNADASYNIFGYNSAELANETDKDGTVLLAEDMRYTADSGSDNTLNINGSYTVGDVGYFDTYTFAKQDSGSDFLTLTTNNFYSGDSSTISMNIDGTEYGRSDSITIKGTHTGTSTIQLINTNAEDLTDNVLGTKLVNVVVKEDGSFSSGGYQYEGALKWYDYSLDKVDTDNNSAVVRNEDGTVEKTVTLDDDDNTQWYISGYATVEDEDTEPGPDEDNPDDDGDEGDKDTEPGPAEPPDDGDGDGGPGPAQPTGNTTTVNTVIASNAVNYYAFRETDKLLRRMGELRNNGEDEQGIWIRVKGAKTGRDSSFENKYTHYELGYDTLVKNDHREKRYEGVSLSYMDGSVKYSGISGSGKAHDEEIAFYRVDQYKHGHYLDLVTRIGMYSNRFGVYDTNQNKIHGKNDTYGISTSAEYGRKKDYAHGWYIEPQGQLTIGYLSGNDYTTSNKVDVSNGCISSLVGRVGANFGKNFGKEKKGIVYLKANWLHEFLGSYSIDMVSNAGNRVHAHGDYRDNWFEYGLGVAYKYTKNNFVYADIERTAGSDYYKNWAWNVGLRWTFN